MMVCQGKAHRLGTLYASYLALRVLGMRKACCKNFSGASSSKHSGINRQFLKIRSTVLMNSRTPLMSPTRKTQL